MLLLLLILVHSLPFEFNTKQLPCALGIQEVKGLKMKTLPVMTVIASLLSFNAMADTTCGDYLGAFRANSLEDVYREYQNGISDMGLTDRTTYGYKFQEASTDQNDKQSKQWMFQRAYNKCNRSASSEMLSEVIKATM